MNKYQFLSMSLPHNLFIQTSFDSWVSSNRPKKIKSGDLEMYSRRRNYDCKPILYPLSDLTKRITHNGETYLDVLRQFIGLRYYYDFEEKSFYFEGGYYGIQKIELMKLPYIGVQKLVEWHFDIANLIEKGEAIDVNTLQTNPYA